MTDISANQEALRLVDGRSAEDILALPRKHPVRVELYHLAAPIAAKGARTIGDWNRPQRMSTERWFSNTWVREREAVLHEITERAVFGGRRPWRNKRKPRREAKFHGWIHERDKTFSTYVWNRAVWDFRDWLKVERYADDDEHDGDTEPRSNRPYWAPFDPFLDALGQDRATTEQIIRRLPNVKHAHILTTLINSGYRFDNPRASRGLVSAYATSQGLSVQRAAQLLGAALAAIRAELKGMDLSDDRWRCPSPYDVTGRVGRRSSARGR